MNTLATEQFGPEPSPTTTERQLAAAGEVTVELVTDELEPAPEITVQPKIRSNRELNPIAELPHPEPTPVPDIIAFLEAQGDPLPDFPTTPLKAIPPKPAKPTRTQLTTTHLTHHAAFAHDLELSLSGHLT